MSEIKILHSKFPPGTPIDFDGEQYYLCATSFRPRVYGDPGSSSPEWVSRLVASDNSKPGLTLISACEKRLKDLGETPGDSPSCTDTSKDCILMIVKDVDPQKASDIVHARVELLASRAVLNFDAALPPDKIVVTKLKATKGSFLQDPDSSDAKAWRVMSDLCESMFLNFKKPAKPRKSSPVKPRR